MSNIIDISLEGKSNPTVNITVNEAGSVTSTGSVSPIINFVTTGQQGPTGSAGADGTAVVSDNSITAAKIADGAVGTPQLATGAVGHQQLANDSVYGSKLADNSIAASKLLDNSIGSDKIADNSVNASKIVNNSITRSLLADDVITSTQIENKSIFGGQIANNTIVKSLIVDNAIDGDKIEDNVTLIGTVTVNHLELEGSSPALIEGPTGDDINIKTHDKLNIQNTLGTAIATIDQSGNITLSGTVDGRDISVDGAKLDGITNNEIIDWTADQGATNIHANNYTDTNTQLSAEEVQDIVGDMVASNVETNISVTYDDANGKLNFASTDTNTTYSEATSSAEGLMSTAHHDKLDGIAAGAEVNVQSDWNSSSGDSQILNKPTIPVDLTTDGTGTIHANNVPTLNQDTTGNAATATTAQGITGATDGDVSITSDGNVTVKLDADNDESSQRLKITNNLDSEIAYISEVGDIFLRGKLTNTGSDSNLNIESDGHINFTLDRDNDETGQYFSFNNYATEIARLDEDGDLQIDGGLTTGSAIELGHASDTTIARSAAGTVTIEGNEIQTTNKHRHFINIGVNLSLAFSRWLPWGSYYVIERNTNNDPEYTTYVAPHDGRFIKLLLRSEEALGDTEIKIYKVGDGTEEPEDGSVVDDKHVDIASANTSYTYTFDSDATFSAGDAMAVRIDPTNDPVAAGVVGTFCLEFDLTT